MCLSQQNIANKGLIDAILLNATNGTFYFLTKRSFNIEEPGCCLVFFFPGQDFFGRYMIEERKKYYVGVRT